MILKNNLCAIVLFLWLLPCNVLGQLNLNQLCELKFGSTFMDSKDIIQTLFSNKASIQKGDFLSSFRIKFDNTSFDYYGDGDYTFQYAKDILVSARVTFDFLAEDTIKFRRLYNAFLNDIGKDPSKKIIKQYSNLNSQIILPYVRKNCIVSGKKEENNYKPIKQKYLGQNLWSIYENYLYYGKFLKVSINLGEMHSGGGGKQDYDGGYVSMVFEVTTQNLQELNNQVENLETINYILINN